MKIRIDGRTYDTTKAERIATYDDGLPRHTTATFGQ